MTPDSERKKATFLDRIIESSKELGRMLLDEVLKYQAIILFAGSALYAGVLFGFGLHPALLFVLMMFTSPLSLRVLFSFYRQRDGLMIAYAQAKAMFREKKNRGEK